MGVYYREALGGAAAWGVRYRESRVTTTRDFDEALDAVRRERPDALYVAMTGQIYLRYKRILNLAADAEVARDLHG
jgi:hypothetical protein